MTTIAWLAQIYVTQRVATEHVDAITLESPLVPIDTVSVAVLGGLLLMGFIFREWKRQRTEGRSLIGGPARDRPDFSPGAMRYLRNFEVDAKVVVAALVRLAAKGRITVRMVGDGIDVTRLENPSEVELTRDEKLVFDKFLGGEDYVDLSNLWGEWCSDTLKALEFYYEEAYGRHHKEPNKPFVYHVALGVFVFLCALGLTTIRPIHALIVLGMLAFGIWSLVFVLEGQIKAHANVVRHRPSFWKLVRSPSMAGAKVLWRFLCELSIGLQELVLGGLCVSFVSLICLGLMLGALGPSALIFFAVLGVSVVAILGLRTRRTLQGAEVLAAIEHYAHGFDAANAGDETGGWADALALGYLDSVGGADEVNDAKEIQALSEQVPTWFSKSQGDAQASDLAQVLAERVPRAFNDAMTIYK
jgi:hypothetical protein